MTPAGQVAETCPASLARRSKVTCLCRRRDPIAPAA